MLEEEILHFMCFLASYELPDQEVRPSLGAVLEHCSPVGPLVECLPVVSGPIVVLLGVPALKQNAGLGAVWGMCVAVNQAK